MNLVMNNTKHKEAKSKNNIVENGLFIFRRDLRIVDNNGLNLLKEYCKNIYTIFIFTPEQVGPSNKYRSVNSIQFMIESLEDLASQISKAGGHLYIFYGHNEKVITDCIESFDIEIVCFNVDYTPYAKERDSKISHLCEKKDVSLLCDYDYYLHNPEEIVSGSNKPYQKFTPYYNTASKKKVEEPYKLRSLPFIKSNHSVPNKITLLEAREKFVKKENPDILVHGGRVNAIKQLRIASKNIKHYSKAHSSISLPTTELSAYIKFGCISIREVYKLFRHNREFIRQLYWRDFYGQILYHFPHVIGHAMKPNYNKLKWHYNSSWFQKWTNGETGFPIVDAAMVQLNTTGYMHNRARLIVASFLIKTLLIDWRHGERYFAEKLVDYDVANNNLNWQWCASSAVDSQPYFRIFNPWLQQSEHDPDCEYIKKWLPELSEAEPKILHQWYKEWSKYKNVKYPKPICNYEEQKEKALAMYKAIY
jgi:deoxyribodipyrimidine photo-lyase